MLSRTLPVFRNSLLALLLGIAFSRQSVAQPDLGIFLHFDSRPSPTFVKNMEHELSAVFPVFRLHWVSPGQTGTLYTYRRVVIVTFHGSCTAAEPVRSGFAEAKAIKLAETQITDGAILPFSEINCDRLRDFLETADPSEMGRESRLGRATGRVLAHELYHVLLQTREHSKKGIGKAVQAPAALLSRSLRFEEGELELISSRYK